MTLTPLNEQYRYYLNKFNKTAKHPHPAELLSLLLLQEKDKFKDEFGEECKNTMDFYFKYKEQIQEKIDKVIVDFALTKAEFDNYIVKIIGQIPEDEKNYEIYKIWYVFASSFNAVRWGNSNHPDWSPERIHNSFAYCWGNNPIPDHLIEEPKQRIKTPSNN